MYQIYNLLKNNKIIILLFLFIFFIILFLPSNCIKLQNSCKSEINNILITKIKNYPYIYETSKAFYWKYFNSKSSSSKYIKIKKTKDEIKFKNTEKMFINGIIGNQKYSKKTPYLPKKEINKWIRSHGGNYNLKFNNSSQINYQNLSKLKLKWKHQSISQSDLDKNGLIARSGNTDKLILNQALENFDIESYDKSLDISDFDTSFVKGLSLEDGASTVTDYSSSLIAKGIKYTNNINSSFTIKCLVCGGGRKNKYLIDSIKKNKTYFKNISLEAIEKYGIDGDFVESQAFGFLAIRKFLDLPISFPGTTRCTKPSTGGVIVKNF